MLQDEHGDAVEPANAAAGGHRGRDWHTAARIPAGGRLLEPPKRDMEVLADADARALEFHDTDFTAQREPANDDVSGWAGPAQPASDDNMAAREVLYVGF